MGTFNNIPQGIVGPQVKGDGSYASSRADKTGATVITDAHGHFYEAVARGSVFAALNTAARALTVSLTTTAGLGIYNPVGSGKNLVIMSTAFRYGSGTLAAGYILHALFPATTGSVTGTVLAPVNLLTGGGGSVARAYELMTGASTAVQVRFAKSVGAMTTDQSTTAWTDVNRELLDGAIVVVPGNAYGIISVTGAGTSPTIWAEYAWEEVNI
jgi:hypothetical protein